MPLAIILGAVVGTSWLGKLMVARLKNWILKWLPTLLFAGTKRGLSWSAYGRRKIILRDAGLISCCGLPACLACLPACLPPPATPCLPPCRGCRALLPGQFVDGSRLVVQIPALAAVFLIIGCMTVLKVRAVTMAITLGTCIAGTIDFPHRSLARTGIRNRYYHWERSDSWGMSWLKRVAPEYSVQ